MDWVDGYVSLVCNLFAEQIRKGNQPNTHLNNVGITEVSDRFFSQPESKQQLKNKQDKLRRSYVAIGLRERSTWTPSGRRR